MHKQLKPDAVPCLFPWTTGNKFARERTERLLWRQHQPSSSDLQDEVSSVSNSDAYIVRLEQRKLFVRVQRLTVFLVRKMFCMYSLLFLLTPVYKQ